MKTILTVGLFFILLLTNKNSPKTVIQQPSFPPALLYPDTLTQALNDLYSQGYINGFTVTLVNESGPLYQKGFGYMDVASKKPYTDSTIQNIASISKTFIGISLMKAQELGKLKLDDPINSYLPFKVINPYFPEKEITIRHLATHTSTITDTRYYDKKSYVLKDDIAANKLKDLNETFNPPSSKTTLLEFLPMILDSKGKYYKKKGFLQELPGTKFDYSNIGATLAALVLELATGVPFDEFTFKYILNPLKMDASGWSYDQIDLSMHSKLYSDTESELPFYELITYPDGGMRTTAKDMGKYLSELIKAKSGKGTLLNPDSYKEYFKEQLNESHFEERDSVFPYNDEYNMGIFIGHSGNGAIGHTGGDPGVSSLMFFDPTTRIGRFLMINTSLTSKEGANEFFGIMNALDDHEAKLSQ
ncbi:serine hydrolase domain-containing protein [Eudoraea sp.]|uniref:serine hydrolase domain-containing protein n=1 Tax=Eudoraea sp. TaxID=1979955 RepID=UPI003C75EEB8